MTTLSDLIESSHCAVYTYGVVAAYVTNKQSALNNQATYRRLRDRLIALAELNNLDVPPASAAYELPLRVSSDSTARTVSAQLENALCAQWADALGYDKELRIKDLVVVPSQAAVRAFAWSGVSYAFPR